MKDAYSVQAQRSYARTTPHMGQSQRPHVHVATVATAATAAREVDGKTSVSHFLRGSQKCGKVRHAVA